MKAFEKLKALVAETEKDANAFYKKGNKSAERRLRKAYPGGKSIGPDWT